ncbi:MAG: DUF4185 domain-containing protein [Deltaproteobacteria bacterium]|jgi:hypothetical protein|nr:DUF4185 domain-containing protein [Deltaproteobacteria bacterium]MBW2532214.1 DUF4185 domain-containing protein [Deltaproteobacteria bacterium]
MKRAGVRALRAAALVSCGYGPVAWGQPYPASTVITEVSFDFATHARLAPGSDNWPITWADDGHQYGAWGDGGGFDGTNQDGRVSLGVARIEGPLSSHQGFNVWGGFNPENPAQFTGKSYGILSVGGTLYMWVSPDPKPHLTEARIAFSTDHGATWQQSSWAFTFADELTIPTFLNFGQDYAGARDGFVYSYYIHPQYGPGESTAAEAVNGFHVHAPGELYLSRVPSDEILTEGSYEFFGGLDTGGDPLWTSDRTEKQPVFRDANGVGWNVSASYNAGLGRYLLMTEHTLTHQAHLGMFDGPEPWGPWTTVVYTDAFGSGEIELTTFYWSFSNKWTSADGRSFTLVFTGRASNDSWNVVEGAFEAESPAAGGAGGAGGSAGAGGATSTGGSGGAGLDAGAAPAGTSSTDDGCGCRVESLAARRDERTSPPAPWWMLPLVVAARRGARKRRPRQPDTAARRSAREHDAARADTVSS